MTLESIYYIGQTIAVVAILASLVAIYYQLRQTQAIERLNAQRDLRVQTREWWRAGSVDETTYRAIVGCLQNFHGAERYTQATFNTWAWNLLNLSEQVLEQHQKNLLDDAPFEGFMQVQLSVLRTPGGQEWWQTASNACSKELSVYLSERLKKEWDDLPMVADLIPIFRQFDA